jgi:methylmalonyl-CoA/ethylmalonyl-CoA epimerase
VTRRARGVLTRIDQTPLRALTLYRLPLTLRRTTASGGVASPPARNVAPRMARLGFGERIFTSGTSFAARASPAPGRVTVGPAATAATGAATAATANVTSERRSMGGGYSVPRRKIEGGVRPDSRLVARAACLHRPSRRLPFVFARIDHVGVAVEDIDAALALYDQSYEMALVHRETVEGQGVEAVLLDVGENHVELLKPLGADTPVGKFLAKRGPGLHHVAYQVTDIVAELERLKAAGVQLIDAEPRVGIRDSRVAFLHPKSSGGVLTEIVQPAEGH